MFDKFIGMLSKSGPLGAVAGALGTALFQGFGAGESAPVGDLASLDWEAIATALGAALAGGKVINDTVKETSPGKAIVPAPVGSGDGDIDGINVGAVTTLLGKVYRGEPIDPDDDDETYNDLSLSLLSRGLSDKDDALAFGIEWGAETRFKGLSDRNELKAGKPANSA